MKKKLNQLSGLWLYSELKQTLPNLVIRATIRDKKAYIDIGQYEYNSITGVGLIRNIIPTMPYEVAFNLLTN